VIYGKIRRPAVFFQLNNVEGIHRTIYIFSETFMNPRVKEASATTDYQIELLFTNGERRVYDCRPLLDFGVFRELRDLAYFKKVKVSGETISWPHEQDICPDMLYLDSCESAVGTE
jgi:hypothetical protein